MLDREPIHVENYPDRISALAGHELLIASLRERIATNPLLTPSMIARQDIQGESANAT